MNGQATFDAIVIGAGHNGLTAAATLARKGKTVCVVERSAQAGGMMAEAALVPGVAVPRLAHLLYNLNGQVARDLGFGGAVPLRSRALATVSLAETGDHVVVRGGEARLADGRAHPEAGAFAALHDRLTRFAAILSRLALHPPPALSGGLTDPATLTELTRLARVGLDLKRLGRAEMQEFLRILMSNVHDLATDELGDGPLAGMLAADAVRGAYMGPRSPGTVFSLLYRLGNGGQPAWPEGGMGAVAGAFAQAARTAGCTLRFGQAVARIAVADDRVRGVVLEDGTEIAAPLVLSSAGPMQTMQMAGPAAFDIETVRRLRHLRSRGTVAKLNAVLSARPAFAGLPPDLHGERLLFAPSSAQVERAFNPVKYGQLPDLPVIELVLPPPAPDGRQALSAVVNFVPPNPEGGWTDTLRERLRATVTGLLERHAPGIGATVLAAEVLAPPDIAALTGAPGGHWHHAEMGLEQILNTRPVIGHARYAFGVTGLYLCGAAAHPGGDITGLPGRNAAMQAIKQGGGE